MTVWVGLLPGKAELQWGHVGNHIRRSSEVAVGGGFGGQRHRLVSIRRCEGPSTAALRPVKRPLGEELRSPLTAQRRAGDGLGEMG